MKRVLIFSLTYYPYVGGAEIAIKEITDRIDSKDIEFHMVTNRFDSTLPKVEKVGNVLVHRIGFALRNTGISKIHHPFFYLVKILYVPLATLKALHLRRDYKFDGWWAMMAYMSFPIVLLRLAWVRVPYVLTLQEGDPFEHVFKRWYIRVFSPLLVWGFRRASVIQAISGFLGRWARRMGFEGPLEIIPNGVATKHFSQSYSADEILSLQQKWGKRSGDTFLITTSRLVEKNAVDDVIRSLSYLPETVHFLVVGIGHNEEALKQLVADCAVERRVHFLGHVGHQDLPRYLKAADIFVRPSRSEGMGNSLIEAMAAELPVIATQEGGIADFLFDAKRNPNKPTTGWTVDKDMPEQIADAVEDILSDPGKTLKVVATAKAMVFEHYDWDSITHEMHTRVFNRFLKR